jgi:LDH2 family malate/lactate/ureidoglycolate dehydrogenase
LGLAIEILAGALVGVSIGAKGTLAERGALILLLHPGAFGVNRDDLASTIQAFLQEVRACRVTDGNEPIRYPGEAGEARLNANRASGQITLPTTVWNQIQA